MAKKLKHAAVRDLPFEEGNQGEGLATILPPDAALPSSVQQGATAFTPDFSELLRHPVIQIPLPTDFAVPVESDHLKSLWSRSDDFRAYEVLQFVHAGGSGMVFEVRMDQHSESWAMKIARHKLFEKHTSSEVPQGLSPVSREELLALEKLSHPNVVRLYDTLSLDGVVFAICTTYVPDPSNLDHYLRTTLQKEWACPLA